MFLIPSRPERSLRNAWPTLALVAFGVVYVLIVAFVPGFTEWSPLVCPSSRIFGFHCPSCGLTRAVACIARLDPWAAVRFHPLVVLIAPAVVLFSIDNFLATLGKPGVLGMLPVAARRAYWIVLLLGFGVMFVVRLASWLAPESNPSGWLLPPQAFPP
jgi:hypothetical protein